MARQSRIGAVDLNWTVVLGFGLGRQRTIAGLRRAFQSNTGTTVEESSFHDKFNAGFAKIMKQGAARALDLGIGASRGLQGQLAGLRDVVLTDSTVVRLHDLLKKKYPGSRANHKPGGAQGTLGDERDRRGHALRAHHAGSPARRAGVSGRQVGRRQAVAGNLFIAE